MITLEMRPKFIYRLDDYNLTYGSTLPYHHIIRDSYIVYDYPLKVGDKIMDLEDLRFGPYIITDIDKDYDGQYARIKEIPFIEYMKTQKNYKHINEEQFPFYDDIIDIIYHKSRIDRDYFFKDLIYVTKKGIIFSYYDVIESEDVTDDLWPLKKYLSSIISATEVYKSCTSISKGLEFIKKLIIPSEIQVGKKNDKLNYHINLRPGSGYYVV